MPSTINGIGTMYYGKRDREERDDVCEHCGRHGKLSSHETTKWFTFFYIPLIPLGKQQIIDMCPTCTWHKAIPAEEWRRIQDEAVDTAGLQFSQNQDDPDAAVQMHATLMTFNRNDEAERLAGIMENKFAGNPDVLLYLAGWFEKRKNAVKSDNLIEKAYKQDPDHLGARRAMGLTYVERNQPAQAKPLLEPFQPGREHFDASTIFLLGKGFQAQGEHEAALNEFRAIAQSVPDVKSEDEFRKAVKVSERALGVTDSMIPDKSLFKSGLLWWLMAALVFVGAVVGYNTHRKNSRHVYVVNGLPVPMTAEFTPIDGGEVKTVTVPAGSRAELRIPEARYRGKVVQPAIEVEPFEFELSVNWFRRMFGGPVFVLDPSRSVVMIREEAIYSVGNQETPPPPQFRAGEPFQAYEKIQYEFTDFPPSLKTKSKRVKKTRLAMEPMPVSALVFQHPEVMVSIEGLARIEQQLGRSMMSSGTLDVYVGLAEHLGERERARDFLKAGRGREQDNLEWHETYQRLAESTGQWKDLVTDYNQPLKNDPKSARYNYLRARLEAGAGSRLLGIKKSAELDEELVEPVEAAATLLESLGRFSDAQQWWERALKIDPEGEHRRVRLWLAMLEQQQIEEVIAAASEVFERTPGDFYSARTLLLAHTMAGEPEKRDEIMESFRTDFLASQGGKDLQQLVTVMEISHAELQGDFARAQNLTEQLRLPMHKKWMTFSLLVLQDKLTEAAGKIKTLSPTEQADARLVLALARRLQDDEQAAAEELTAAIAQFKQLGGGEQLFATLLENSLKQPLPATAWDAAPVDGWLKAVVLCYLAADRPEQAEAYLQRSRELISLPGRSGTLLGKAYEKWGK